MFLVGPNTTQLGMLSSYYFEVAGLPTTEAQTNLSFSQGVSKVKASQMHQLPAFG
jgi:hypothetical protein